MRGPFQDAFDPETRLGGCPCGQHASLEAHNRSLTATPVARESGVEELTAR